VPPTRRGRHTGPTRRLAGCSGTHRRHLDELIVIVNMTVIGSISMKACRSAEPIPGRRTTGRPFRPRHRFPEWTAQSPEGESP
jgi:hypothetical protein